MEVIKHDNCLYVVDSIYLDPASENLYYLFLHCDYCGKPIKLCVRTENDVVNWLSRKKGNWIKTMNDFHICSLCGGYGNPNYFNFCSKCGAEMRKDEEDG